jgi:mediator of RNA polymerase II transcription subunit 16
LVFDKKAINTLRELLTIFRVWSLLNESCLPVFTRLNENVDVIATLYKLLTRCLASDVPDEQLLDECVLLPNNVLIPQIQLALKPIGICSPALFAQPMALQLPLRLHFYRDAPQLRTQIKIPMLDGAVRNSQNARTDVVRHIRLGNGFSDAGNLRTCSRCDSVSLLQPPVKSSATRAWDQRWLRNCVCGGHWRTCNGLSS